jgi:hypothetical protein
MIAALLGVKLSTVDKYAAECRYHSTADDPAAADAATGSQPTPATPATSTGNQQKNSRKTANSADIKPLRW